MVLRTLIVGGGLEITDVLQCLHKESRKIANTRDVTTNRCNTLDHTKWPSKTSSLARMNYACRDTARKLQKVSVYIK